VNLFRNSGLGPGGNCDTRGQLWCQQEAHVFQPYDWGVTVTAMDHMYDLQSRCQRVMLMSHDDDEEHQQEHSAEYFDSESVQKHAIKQFLVLRPSIRARCVR
jgi:hypothetical protein